MVNPLHKLMLLYGLYLLCCFPLFSAGFIWDDAEHFLHDPLQLREGGLWDIWFSPNTGVWNYWPLTRSSFWLEHQLWGISAFAAHTINIILHGLAGLFFYLSLKRLQCNFALAALAVFLLHPAVMESVAWVTERKNVLSMFMVMVSAYAFIRYYLDDNIWFAVLSALFFVFALLSKTSIISLPFLLLLVLWLRDGKVQTKNLVLLALLFALGFIAAFGSFYFEENYIGSTLELFQLSLVQKIMLAGQVYIFYLALFLNPFSNNFIYPRFDVSQPDPMGFLPLILCALILLFCLVLFVKRKNRAPLVFFIAYLAVLLPVSGIFRVYGMRFSYVSDHWFYPAIVPLSIFSAWLFYLLWKKVGETAGVAIATLFLATMSINSFVHAGDFQNQKRLWLITLQNNPDAYLARIGLCKILMDEGYLESAYEHCEYATRSEDQFASTWLNMGMIAGAQGDLETSVKYFNKALELYDRFAPAHLALGETWFRQGNYKKAIDHFNLAIKFSPEDEDVYRVSAKYLEKMKMFDEAKKVYREGYKNIPYSDFLKHKAEQVFPAK